MTHLSARNAHTDLSAFFPSDLMNPLTQGKSVTVFHGSGYIDYDEFHDELAVKIGAPVVPFYVNIELEKVYPRGIKWHDFPVVSKPWYKLAKCSDVIKTWNSGNNIVEASIHAVIPNKIAVKTCSMDPAMAAHLIHHVAYLLVSAGHGELTIWHDVYGEIQGNTALELLELNKAHFRFLYSYAFNFKAIGLNALRASIVGSSEATQGLSEKYMGVPVWNPRENIPRAMLNPFALQMLYRLRGVDSLYVARDNHFELRDVMGQVGNNWAWVGSGKYAPLFAESPLLGNFSVQRQVIKSLQFVSVSVKSESAATLSDVGHRFLDMLHKDNEDPDVMIRWLNPKTGVIDEKHSDAVDDWLMRFFCKMKTQVNKV